MEEFTIKFPVKTDEHGISIFDANGKLLFVAANDSFKDITTFAVNALNEYKRVTHALFLQQMRHIGE